MVNYSKFWMVKPMAFNPHDDYENGEWMDVRKVWNHTIEKNGFVFSEYCFTEYPYQGFFARASEAFRKAA